MTYSSLKTITFHKNILASFKLGGHGDYLDWREKGHYLNSSSIYSNTQALSKHVYYINIYHETW